MDNFLVKLIIFFSRFLLMLIVIITTVGIGAYLAFLTYQTIFYIPNVKVPSVLNRELDVAQQILHRSGLKMKVIDHHLFREGDHFFVISQNPQAGTEIKKNRTVEVEIKESRIFNEVPNLVGKTIEEAENLLLESGYRMGNIAYSLHQQIAQGRIIAQTPQPGANVQTKSEIDILVSKGLY